MPYITREDGVRFVIPSYRDTLSAKKTSLLKREILLLSTNYGEYITLQKKNADQYEVAFSPDSGYLLGECLWQHFNRPYDMIYCEAIPNTTEAILVIVKAGSVYLDGTFSLDSIPEELVIFKTQKNNFDIFIYGDVPLSATSEEGKFSFDEGSVRAFTVLDTPVFPTLEAYRAFQLQLVEVVLKAQGIGVVPIRQILLSIVSLILLYAAYSYFFGEKPTEVIQAVVAPPPKYQGYYQSLTSPSPTAEINALIPKLYELMTIPGWQLAGLDYVPGTPGTIKALVQSVGGRTQALWQWAQLNHWDMQIVEGNVQLLGTINPSGRQAPKYVTPMLEVNSLLVDRLSFDLVGVDLRFGKVQKVVDYQEGEININFSEVAPSVLSLIATKINGLPLVTNKITLTVTKSQLTGSIKLKALGN